MRTSVASILGNNSRKDEFLQENYNDSNLKTQASDVQLTQSNTISNAIFFYLNNDKSECAIAFWKNNIYEYPILSILASIILAAPATSVPSERLFSHADVPFKFKDIKTCLVKIKDTIAWKPKTERSARGPRTKSKLPEYYNKKLNVNVISQVNQSSTDITS
ncbi:hypothetical protein BpHYR1_015414 [Brachionus plicatilis]|uniref:HAT C-terminal dimerisation domain-containing protein n=1 Tax=Brachionus plicatilis TaxID=10195 RepID=A0A3M7R212_BRAPC|nr:hypothetical protein BpHYR1_015414 [Brachionus plicatilis]